MTVIAEHLRMAQLQRLGLSQALVRLAAGDCVHEVFRGHCLGPPFRVYHGARVPEGPLLVPLWEQDGRVCGVWEVDGGLAFVEFSIELPDAFELVARTEQGFWATRFDFLVECEVSGPLLEEAACRVGFRFLERQLDAMDEAGSQLGSFLGHRSWLNELVAGIDRDAHEG